MLDLNKHLKSFFLPIALSLAIVILSVIPVEQFPDPELVPMDKLTHLFAFLFLVLGYLFAFRRMSGQDNISKFFILVSLSICIVLGGLTELLQHYLPLNRYGDWFDFYFDIAGVFLGLLIFFAMNITRTITLVGYK